MLLQVAACLATGNVSVIAASASLHGTFDSLPAALAGRIVTADAAGGTMADLFFFEGRTDELRQRLGDVTALKGPIRAVLTLTPEQFAAGDINPPDMLLAERSISTNTSAAGGNASPMSL